MSLPPAVLLEGLWRWEGAWHELLVHHVLEVSAGEAGGKVPGLGCWGSCLQELLHPGGRMCSRGSLCFCSSSVSDHTLQRKTLSLSNPIIC